MAEDPEVVRYGQDRGDREAIHFVETKPRVSNLKYEYIEIGCSKEISWKK